MITTFTETMVYACYGDLISDAARTGTHALSTSHFFHLMLYPVFHCMLHVMSLFPVYSLPNHWQLLVV